MSLLLMTQAFKTHHLSGLGSFETYVTQNTQGKEEQSWLVHATSTALKCKKDSEEKGSSAAPSLTGTAQFTLEAFLPPFGKSS